MYKTWFKTRCGYIKEIRLGKLKLGWDSLFYSILGNKKKVEKSRMHLPGPHLPCLFSLYMQPYIVNMLLIVHSRAKLN